MPREKRSAPRLAAAIAAVIGLTGLAPAACGRKPEAAAPEIPVEAPAPVVRAPALPPPVGRAELLQAIAAARSAYAAGQDDTAPGLAGRRFAIRQAFGCRGGVEAGAGQGAEPAAGVPGWTPARDRRSIELRLTPADWTGSPVVLAGGAGWEAVEGYWLTRPWLRTEGCPAAPPAAPGLSAAAAAGSPAVAASLISGLAVVFPPQSSRLGRRNGRPFTWTLRGDPPPWPANGFRLVVEGRFAAFPGGRAIRCGGVSIDQPPVCLVAAEVDRVAFEDAEGHLLKEWRAA